MLSDYMGIINLNENEDNLKSLTRNRPLASIPIGGRYRIIDFTLSNIVNTGIKMVGIFTQSNSRSLVDHLGSGKPWDLDRKINGLFVFNFGASSMSDVEMFKNNIDYFNQSHQSKVIVAPSYMLCNINYQDAIKFHEETGSPITVIYKKITDGTKNFIDCDCLNINEQGNVISVGKNIGANDSINISMEMFIMDKTTFVSLVNECIETGYYRSLKEIIYKNTNLLKMNAYEYKGYLECINSIKTYYKANMNMLDMKNLKDLFFSANGTIFTKVKDEAPTKYTKECTVSDSLIANGCVLEGTIENSIIARRVIIRKGAKIKNCIIMQNCEIKENAELVDVILDKNVEISKNKQLKGDKEFPLVIEKNSII